MSPSDAAENRRAPAAELAAVCAAILAIAIAGTWPLARHIRTALPNDLGDPLLNAWILAWDASALAHGGRGLWQAPSFFPYANTLAYSDHLLGLAIFTAPLQWLTKNPILVYNVAFLASFATAAGAMYLLARSLVGRGDAAFIAALMFAFAPFRIAHIAHVQWETTMWLPLGLWALHRWAASGVLSDLLAVVACYLLQSLTAMYFTYFALVPLGVAGIVAVWRRRDSIGRTAVQLAIGAAIAAVVLTPFVRVYGWVRADRGFHRTSEEIRNYSADVSDYLRGHTLIHLWRGARPGTGEHELFPGAVMIGLALTAVVAAPHSRRTLVAIYGTIAILAFALSLGPQPSAWGVRAPFPGPYHLLLASVPGLDGLRAASRLAVIVVLALTVIAAIGAATLLEQVSRRARIALVTGLCIAIVGESWAAPIPIARIDPTGSTANRAAFEFIRDGGAGAVVDVPVTLDDRELMYQYLTLAHGHRTVNGSSSYETPIHQFLARPDQSPLADPSRLPEALAFLRGFGIRYFVVHDDAALTARLRAEASNVAGRAEAGGVAVLALEPDRTPVDMRGLREIPTAAIQARASIANERVPLLFDGDRDTRWLTGRAQRGDEWIELTFDHPRDVALVRMQTAERSFADYPRGLDIESVETAGTRTLYRGSVLGAFGRALAADYRYPTIEMTLSENRTVTLRLRQTGTTDQLFWSIHELRVWER